MKTIVKINELKEFEVQILAEAFKSGQAGIVVEKLGRILGRKIGKSVKFSSTPIKYENEYGAFAGYLGSINGGESYIMFEFLLTKSDKPYSWSFFGGKITSKPDYTVDIYDLNIVQIVDNIVNNLVEDGEIEDTILLSASVQDKGKNNIEERGRPSVGSVEDWLPVIEKWVNSENLTNTIQKESVPDLYNNYFMKWAANKPRYLELKYYLFNKVIKRFLLERGMTNKTLKPRKKGSKIRQIEDPIMNAKMQDVVETMSWKKKFDKLKKFVKAMTDNMVQSIYLYGSPGSGKSKTVYDTLDAEGVDYKVYKGGVGGTSELVQILYNNRDNTILVFDDFDSARKNKDQVNILKAALENTPKREITWAKKVPKGMDFPPRFEFTSGIIFISNDPKIDSALASRSVNLEISLNSEQMIDKMNETLANFLPDVSMKIKKTALDFASEVAGGVAGGIDYRILEKIIIAIQIDPQDWKDTAYMMLASLG